MLEVTIEESDPLFKVKLELIESSNNKFRVSLFPTFHIQESWDIISFLRWVYYDEDESWLLFARNECITMKYNVYLQQGGKPEEWNPKGQFTGSEVNYVSLKCERNVFKNLSRLCLAKLATFKTTLQQDIEAV